MPDLPVRTDAPPELSGAPVLGTASPLTPLEENDLYAARAQKLLARFGDKLGKHGPLAAVRNPVMLRLPRETDLRLDQLAGELGTSKAGLLAQASVVISKIAPEQYYAALAGLAKHYGRA